MIQVNRFNSFFAILSANFKNMVSRKRALKFSIRKKSIIPLDARRFQELYLLNYLELGNETSRKYPPTMSLLIALKKKKSLFLPSQPTAPLSENFQFGQ